MNFLMPLVRTFVEELLDTGEGEAKDPKDPTCDVYLYTRPLVREKGEPPLAKHWILYFEWSNESVTHEGVECNGKLTHRTNDGKPQAPGNLTFEVEVIKRGVKVSRQKVDEKAAANQFNGKPYNIISTNCQHWTTEHGRLLGIKLPMGQVKMANTVVEAAKAPLGLGRFPVRDVLAVTEQVARSLARN